MTYHSESPYNPPTPTNRALITHRQSHCFPTLGHSTSIMRDVKSLDDKNLEFRPTVAICFQPLATTLKVRT